MESNRNPESQPRVLVVEDEPDLAALIAYQLTMDGIRVEAAATGAAALDAVRRETPDLILLDRMLSGMKGDVVLKALRRVKGTSCIPVLVLTARPEREDSVKGGKLHADEYLAKPFSPRELVRRVRALLRRGQEVGVEAGGRILHAGPLRLDVESQGAWIDDAEIDLTPTEFRLLQALLERRGRTQSRKQLLERAWDIDPVGSDRLHTRTVDMHVRRLRAKLGDIAVWIQTVRGFGYRIKVPEGVE